MNKRIILLSLTVLSSLQLFAWGQKGHRIIAGIAYEYMSDRTKDRVDAILGKHGLVYLANLPDELKSDSTYDYTYDWHFQDLPPGLTDDELVRLRNSYPIEGGHLWFVYDSICKRLQTMDNDTMALIYVVHLTGDFFCPTHLAHLDDKGGNTIRMKWFNYSTNMHTVWDDKLIDSQGYSYTEYIEYLEDRFDGESQFLFNASAAELTANNYHLVSAIYEYQPSYDGNAYHYIYRWREAAEHQLFVAGVRLAKILNELYE